MPVCTTAERMAHLRSSCPKRSPSLESMTAEEIKALFSGWNVVKEVNVLACFHLKVASQTWKKILCENVHRNNQSQVKHCYKRKDPLSSYYHERLNGSKESMLQQITNYKKLMVVRHPLDRLVSVWAHKFKNNPQLNGTYMMKHRTRLLAQSRPWLSEEEAGDSVYFQEMIEYILAGNQNNHWNGPYSQKCNPCIINFDAVVKLETFYTEGTTIINDILAGKGNLVHTHQTSTSSWSERYIKVLPEYKNISGQMLEKVIEKYQKISPSLAMALND